MLQATDYAQLVRMTTLTGADHFDLPGISGRSELSAHHRRGGDRVDRLFRRREIHIRCGTQSLDHRDLVARADLFDDLGKISREEVNA